MHAALNVGVTFGGVSKNTAMALVLGTAVVAALAVAALTGATSLRAAFACAAELDLYLEALLSPS